MTIHGDDVLAHANWEIGETWLRRYGFVSPFFLRLLALIAPCLGTHQILGRSKHAGHLQQMETGARPARIAYGRYRTRAAADIDID